MRKIKTLLLVLTIAICASCNNDGSSSNLSQAGDMLTGNHELHYLRLGVDSVGATPQYFKVRTVPSSGCKMLMYCWTLPDSSMTTSELPLTSVRLKFDENILTPFVKYRWRPNYGGHSTVEEILSQQVVYMVVTCRESDFPNNIHVGE